MVIVSIHVGRLVRREGFRVRIKRSKKGGGLRQEWLSGLGLTKIKRGGGGG